MSEYIEARVEQWCIHKSTTIPNDHLSKIAIYFRAIASGGCMYPDTVEAYILSSLLKIRMALGIVDSDQKFFGVCDVLGHPNPERDVFLGCVEGSDSWVAFTPISPEQALQNLHRSRRPQHLGGIASFKGGKGVGKTLFKKVQAQTDFDSVSSISIPLSSSTQSRADPYAKDTTVHPKIRRWVYKNDGESKMSTVKTIRKSQVHWASTP